MALVCVYTYILLYITATIFRFIDEMFCWYLHYRSVGKKIPDKIIYKKSLSVNLLLVFFLSVFSSITYLVELLLVRWCYLSVARAASLAVIP